MSKKTKDSVNEYFSHDYHARNDPKLQKLQAKMGHDGKGIYWDIIELLYEQGGKLLVSEIETYAFSIRCEKIAFQNVISDFDLFTNDGEYFWSASVLKRLKLRGIKSANASKSANKRWKKQDAIALPTHSDRIANALPTQSDRNAIKEKKRKEKNIKEYEIKEKEIQNPFGVEFLKKWDEWKEYRKVSKKPILPISEQKAINELFKLAGGNENIASEMIDSSIANGWQGLFERKAANGSTRPQTENQRLNDIARNGGHLKTDEKKWVQIKGKITQGEFELDGEGNMVMYCGRETLKVYPNDGFRSNVLYDLKPGNTIQEVHQYLLSERKLQIAS